MYILRSKYMAYRIKVYMRDYMFISDMRKGDYKLCFPFKK